MNILLLGSQHGNEHLGDALYSHIATKRRELLPHVVYIIGNPMAHAKNVRYLESDLNRSYGKQQKTYEEKRATELLQIIKSAKFDLVLDLHTTRCIQPPSIIVGGDSAKTKRFITATSIRHIVHMKHSIVKTSLIGVCSHAVSIEINYKAVSQRLLSLLCDDIERCILNISSLSAHTEYEIYDMLVKDELTDAEVGALINFKKALRGFYPILVGENSYKAQTSYLGFKARIIETKSYKGTV